MKDFAVSIQSYRRTWDRIMHATKETYLLKFKELHKAKTGKELSAEDALDLFEKLVVLVETTYKPIPIESWKQNKIESFAPQSRKL